ncbi:MAG TPA: 8-oxo-dGTP diphosphatase MutT [Verrucomicrobiae bacterium]|jgi:mutator protein MutT|nr:8-oxo-dGTP diphosphatase MutT [Verrucomicrobiae bacterium]
MKKPSEPSRNPQSGTYHPVEIDVSAALIFDQGRLLITRRRAGSHLGGLWEFPGGKREPNETFEQCLVREIHEELGMNIAVGELFEEITHAYEEKTVHLKFFICTWIDGAPQALGCESFEWVEKNALQQYKFPAADARLLGKLLREDHFFAED